MAERKNRRAAQWDPNWYNYGSAAPAIQHEEYEIPETRQNYDSPAKAAEIIAEPVRETKVAFVAEKRTDAVKLLKNIAFFAIMFAICSFVLTRYAMISSKNLENQKIAENIDNMETQVELLDVSINEARDLAMLQKRAEELGLGFAETEQVRYITVEIPSEAEPAAEDEGFDIFGMIEKLHDIFG